MSDETMKVFEKRAAGRDHNLNELFGMMRDFGEKFEELSTAFTVHMKSEEAGVRLQIEALNALSARVEEIAKLHKAFPVDEDGEPDIKGHRRYHSNLIAGSRESGKFWANRKDEAGKIVLYAIMTVCLLGVNTYITKTAAEGQHHEAAK
jgi:hypothetical protein